jgi:hypothetical protein
MNSYQKSIEILTEVTQYLELKWLEYSRAEKTT